jgi:glyoxylase-like metal-dependent hydrolase (beta-lactamase superfamily II)
MRRAIVVGALVVIGALCSVAAKPQGQPQATQNVQVQTLDVRDILYILKGGGGNTLALMRDDGVVLIDTKEPGWGRPLLQAVQTVTDKPVTMIINTHTHADHTGGNIDFPTATQIVAHERTKIAMQKMDAFKGANAKALPNKTFTDRLTFFDGIDRMDLYYFGRGHTDGDLVVVFPEKRVAHFGDLFPSKAAPFIDTANGGSGLAFPETLAKALAEIKGVVRVTTGHDEASFIPRDAGSGSAIFANPRTMSWNDLQEYADFNRDFLAAVQAAIKAGKTSAEAAAGLQLPDRYKAYDMQQAKANVEKIYRELGK